MTVSAATSSSNPSALDERDATIASLESKLGKQAKQIKRLTAENAKYRQGLGKVRKTLAGANALTANRRRQEALEIIETTLTKKKVKKGSKKSATKSTKKGPKSKSTIVDRLMH